MDLLPERQGFLGHVNMLPIIQGHLSDILEFVMMREIDDFLDFKSDVIFVHQKEDLLLVIHNNQTLNTALFNVIDHQLTVRLKSHQSASWQLKYFQLGDFIRLRCMELQLYNLVNISLTFNEENFLVETPDQVSADHIFWFANDFENVFVD